LCGYFSFYICFQLFSYTPHVYFMDVQTECRFVNFGVFYERWLAFKLASHISERVWMTNWRPLDNVWVIAPRCKKKWLWRHWISKVGWWGCWCTRRTYWYLMVKIMAIVCYFLLLYGEKCCLICCYIFFVLTVCFLRVWNWCTWNLRLFRSRGC
jgi:hypothetical protein